MLSWVEFGDENDYFSSDEASDWPSIETLTDHPTETEVLVNGAKSAATVWRTQTASAWQVQTDQVTISVAARSVSLTAQEMAEITDLEPYKQRRAPNGEGAGVVRIVEWSPNEGFDRSRPRVGGSPSQARRLTRGGFG